MGIWITLIAGAVMAGSLWLQTERLGAVNERLDATQSQNETLTEILELNEATLNACKIVNASNAAQREIALVAAAQAKENLIELDRVTTQTINRITDEAEALRNVPDKTCRTLTDTLPDDFIEWVWND